MSAVTVLFRVDAGVSLGLGHLMRCRAIAEAVTEQGGKAVFAMVDPPSALLPMIAGIPARLLTLPGPANSQADLDGLLKLIRRLEPRVTVVDAYHLDDAYLRAIRQESPLGVLWDSADHQDVSAHLIVDSSPSAPADAYAAISPEAILLLGAEFALIRRDIRQAARRAQVPLAERHEVVLSFGGSDPLNLSMALLPVLRERLPSTVGITVLSGAAYPHHQDLRRVASAIDGRGVVRLIVNPPAVASVFCSAGLVVSAAGSTMGELAALGVPALSVLVAQNQVAASAKSPYPWIDGRLPGALERIAIQTVEMWHDFRVREHLAGQLRGLVDGNGAWRVANTLLTMQFRENL